MLSLTLLLACHKDDGTVPGVAPSGVGISGVRRLSRDECDNTLRDILGDESRPCTAFLPEDVVDPFDNDAAMQEPSAVLVTGWEALANDVAVRFVTDLDRRADILPCTPSGSGDEACLRAFVTDTGRRALRRPVTLAEADALVAVGAEICGGVR